jgi:D-sedoheptulose 7-phosphate isomerase
MELNLYLKKFTDILQQINLTEVETAINLIQEKYDQGKTIFVIGNGGSAANASHFAQDMAKGVFLDQSVAKRIRALSLTDNTPYMTALGNDDGYDRIFEAQLRTFANEGDLLVIISGSGNSKNVLRAIDFCKEKGLSTIGFSGFDGGKMKTSLDVEVHIPLNEMCTVESVHSVIFHYIIIELRERLTGTPFDGSCLQLNNIDNG